MHRESGGSGDATSLIEHDVRIAYAQARVTAAARRTPGGAGQRAESGGSGGSRPGGVVRRAKTGYGTKTEVGRRDPELEKCHQRARVPGD